MSTANAWTVPANDGAPRPDNGWSLRTRLGFTDIITLLWRQKWLMAAIFIVIFSLGLAYAMTQKTEYVANASLWIKLSDEDVLHPRAGGAGAGAVSDVDGMIDRESKILGSSGLYRRVIARIGIEKVYPDINVGRTAADHEAAMSQAVARFAKNFESGAGVKMPTIPLSFQHENPEMAALALNTLIDEYKIFRHSIVLNSNGAALQSEKVTREDQLAAVDDQIQAFLTFNNIGDFDTEKSLASTNLTQQAAQKNQLTASLQEARARLTAADARMAGYPTEIQQSRDLDMTRQQALNAAQLDLAKARAAFLPSAPQVTSLEQQIAGQQDALRQAPPAGDLRVTMAPNPLRQSLESDRNNAGTAVAGLQASLNAVNAEIARITQRQQLLAQLEPQYRDLVDQRKNLQDSVSGFDRQALESSASDAIAQTGNDNVRVISNAEIPLQGSSKRKLIAGLALVFAAFTALCAGLLNVFLKTGLPTAVAAGRTLDLPVLGTARVKR